VAALVVAVTILVATPISRVQWNTVDASSLPSSAQAFQADRAINRSPEFVPNGGTPFYLALKAPPTAAAAAAALAAAARHLGGVPAAPPPRFPGATPRKTTWTAARPPYRTTTQDLVAQLRALESGYRLLVGGDAAAFHDERSAIASHLPIAIALLAAATLIILFMLSGSLVAPLLSLLMTALTLAA